MDDQEKIDDIVAGRLEEMSAVQAGIFTPEEVYEYWQIRGKKVRTEIEKGLASGLFKDSTPEQMQDWLTQLSGIASNYAKRKMLGLEPRDKKQALREIKTKKFSIEETVKRVEARTAAPLGGLTQ
jgi:hypothetical protein